MSRFFTEWQRDIKIVGSQNQLLKVAFYRDVFFWTS